MPLTIFYDPDHAQHDPVGLTPTVAEVAERGQLIRQAVEAAALGPLLPPADFGLEPLATVHTPALIGLLQTAYERMAAARGFAGPVVPNSFAVRGLCRGPGESIWGQLGYHCTDTTTPILAGTWPAAYGAAQVALSAAAQVAQEGGSAYALCRPPGHHASADLFGGFCYLNNAAMAANWLCQKGQRLAILDLDYHHGNGTQAIFYDRADVLFCSLHADPASDYPFYAGYRDERGSGPGAGFNFNFPLPLGCQEAAYFAALDQALEQVNRFQPDTLLISLGVDTFAGDPVGGFRLTAGTFRRLGTRLAALHRPTLIIQEGGYLLSHLGQNVVAFLQAFAAP